MKFVQPIRDISKIEQMKQSFNNERDRFMFVLGINSGLRISDMLPLTVEDVTDRTHIVIKEQKTGKTKRFPINHILKQEIENYTKDMNQEDILFPSRKGDQPISRVQAHRILSEAGTKVGLEDISSHSLRKTFGYHFYKRTKDVVMLQKIFNHGSPSVTLRYIGIEQDEIDEQLMNFGL